MATAWDVGAPSCISLRMTILPRGVTFLTRSWQHNAGRRTLLLPINLGVQIIVLWRRPHHVWLISSWIQIRKSITCCYEHCHYQITWSWYSENFEWPHRQCVSLVFWSRTFAADSVQQVLWFVARIVVCNTLSSGGTALCRVWGAISQLDLPSLTPLSVAGCGWLQLGVPHWATSVITASSW